MASAEHQHQTLTSSHVKETKASPNDPLPDAEAHIVADVQSVNAFSDTRLLITDPGRLSKFGDEDSPQLNVRIIDTEEIKGKLLKHTSFIIESPRSSDHTVSRRYNDFKWLRNMLSLEYLCIFVPPIPVANLLKKFDKAFLSQRRYDLQRFLNRVFTDKLLSKSQSLEVFLTQQSQTRFEEQQKQIKVEIHSNDSFEYIPSDSISEHKIYHRIY